MKKMILAVMAFVSGVCVANTMTIFAKDGSKGTVLVIGSPQDHEAWRFYETLTVPAQDMNGKWTKVYLFDDSAGNRVFSASCVFSKILKENGTCTLTVFPAPGVTLDSPSGVIHYETVTAEDAAKMALGFDPPDATGLVYANDNGRLRVETRTNKDGTLSMSLGYR